jgi:hypothetical protein
MQIFPDVKFSDHPKKDLALTGNWLYNYWLYKSVQTLVTEVLQKLPQIYKLC